VQHADQVTDHLRVEASRQLQARTHSRIVENLRGARVPQPTRLRRYGGPWHLQAIGSSQDDELTPGEIRTRSGTTRTSATNRHTKETADGSELHAQIVDRSRSRFICWADRPRLDQVAAVESNWRPLRSGNRSHRGVKKRRLSVVIMR
jgi:hypothetical protein